MASAWAPCPDCDEFWCVIHGEHAADCDCPPIDEWDTDPYGEGGQDEADQADIPG